MNEPLLFETPREIALQIAKKEKNYRKSKGISQVELSQMCGVPTPTLRLFEQKGEISFVSLIKICLSLNCIHYIKNMFNEISYKSIDQVIKNEKRHK